MEQDKWIDYKIKLRDRLKVFAVNILELSASSPDNPDRAYWIINSPKQGHRHMQITVLLWEADQKQSFSANFQFQLKKQMNQRCGSIL